MFEDVPREMLSFEPTPEVLHYIKGMFLILRSRQNEFKKYEASAPNDVIKEYWRGRLEQIAELMIMMLPYVPKSVYQERPE
jgi:hypothetical protein